MSTQDSGLFKVLIYGEKNDLSTLLIDKTHFNGGKMNTYIGVTFHIHADSLSDGFTYKLQIWDFHNRIKDDIRKKFSFGAHGAILLTYTSEKIQWKKILPYYYESRHVIGNKPITILDVNVNPAIKSQEELKRWAKERDIQYFMLDPHKGIDTDIIRSLAQRMYRCEFEKIPPTPKYSDLSITEDEIIQDIDFIVKKKLPRLNKTERLGFGYRSEEDTITELGLEGYNLADLPLSFANLTNLRKLNIDNNRLNTIPSQLWNLDALQDLCMIRNPLDFQSKTIVNNIDEIRKYSRTKTKINIFISYSDLDKIKYQLNDLAAELEKREGIGEVFYFDTKQEGEIEHYMITKIPQSQIFMVLITENTLASAPCKFEIDNALEHNIMILPFLDKSIDWSDSRLEHIKGFRGVLADKSSPKDSWPELFQEIDDLKRRFNLYDRTYEKIDLLITELEILLKQENYRTHIDSDENLNQYLDKFKKNPQERFNLLRSFSKMLHDKLRED